VLLPLLGIAVVLYLGSTGLIPGTPAAAWRDRIETLEGTVALMQVRPCVRVASHLYFFFVEDSPACLLSCSC
jgi:hypothetical protein